MAFTPPRSSPVPFGSGKGGSAANQPGSGDGRMRKTHFLSSALVQTVSSNVAHNNNMNNATSNNNSTLYTADRKLHEQFQFFKDEFIRTAVRMDIAMPTDMVEEKTAHLRPFLEYNGPKYVFQIISSHITEISITRPGLSLMVTTLALFKKHLPKSYQEGPGQFLQDQAKSGNTNTIPSYHQQHALTHDELWATSMISKITDAVTVTGCVSILISTHNPIIQELIINLIAGLISISDDAITQILQVPNILYTQTNKKIPASNNNDSNREKLLSTLYRKMLKTAAAAAAGEAGPGGLPGMVGGSGPGTGPSSNYESRRNSSPTPNMNNPADPSNRYSFRGFIDKSNSKLLYGGRDRTSTADDNDPDCDEFQCCLAYIFSIVLMQKNRHLLLAGCADIIIAMTKSSNNSMLCEYIARVSTAPLPLIDLHKNQEKNRGFGHSLKHLSSGMAQPQIEPLHVNPLGARVVDWAGVRIPLKFLQRYHQIFGTNLTRAGALVSQEKPSTGSNNPNYPSSVPATANNNITTDSSLILNEGIKSEYRYAHNRALLAVCSLLVAAHDVVSYVVQLQGAIDVIKLSASIYSEDDLPPNRGPASTLAEINNRETMVNRTTIQPNAQRGRLIYDASSNLPPVIITALNALQLEKQHQHRMRAILNHHLQQQNQQGSLGSSSNSRRSSNTIGHGPAVAAATALHQQHPSAAAVAQKIAGLVQSNNNNNGSKNPSTSNSVSVSSSLSKLKPSQIVGKSAVSSSQPSLQLSSSQQLLGSAPKREQLTENIQLSSHPPIDRPFNAAYTAETEKFNLYLQNQQDANNYKQAPASPLQYYAANQISKQSKGPLQFQQQSTKDPLLHSSLKTIEQQKGEALFKPPKTSKSPTMFNSNVPGNVDTNVSLTNSEGQIYGISIHIEDPDPNNFTGKGPISPYASHPGMSASRNFFGALPGLPIVPDRIEAKDVIVKGESLSRIRKKFQLLAENAVKHIEGTGKKCYVLVGICVGVNVLLLRYSFCENSF